MRCILWVHRTLPCTTLAVLVFVSGRQLTGGESLHQKHEITQQPVSPVCIVYKRGRPAPLIRVEPCSRATPPVITHPTMMSTPEERRQELCGPTTQLCSLRRAGDASMICEGAPRLTRDTRDGTQEDRFGARASWDPPCSGRRAAPPPTCQRTAREAPSVSATFSGGHRNQTSREPSTRLFPLLLSQFGTRGRWNT